MAKEVVCELFSLLELYGVRHVVCSPGSRNAVLLMEAESHPDIEKTVVVDERSAAFIALGIALCTRRPVALICTSGSALLNYAPALAEAFYQGIPLIVISADRPVEWIDQDDSQTIRQLGPLDNFTKGCYDLLGDPLHDDYLWYVNRIINEGLQKSLAPKRGPVQFNVHLDGRADLTPDSLGLSRKILQVTPVQKVSREDLGNLAEMAFKANIMIVAGFMLPDHRMQRAFSLLQELPNVVIMAETVSNLHLDPSCYNIDRVFFSNGESILEKYRPEIIISVGGALISRKLKEYLRKCKVRHHWSLGYSDNLVDCFQALSLKIEADPASFLKSFAKLVARKQAQSHFSSDYRAAWSGLRKVWEDVFSRLPWCDLKALHLVFSSLPADADLFLSNGTSVRYGQILPFFPFHAIYSNRGVSGIEGCSSTALGISLCNGRLTCLVTGDMSFEYDLGALASGLASSNLLIVVLDNGGGDIFRFINATKDLPIREKYLCASKSISVRKLALAFGFDYFAASSVEELQKALKDVLIPGRLPRILHLITREAESNSEILRKFLKSRI